MYGNHVNLDSFYLDLCSLLILLIILKNNEKKCDILSHFFSIGIIIVQNP